MQVYVKVLLLKKYLRSKLRKKFFMAFLGEFYEPPDIRQNTFKI